MYSKIQPIPHSKHTASALQKIKSANSLQEINFVCLWEPYKPYRCAQCRVADSETLWCIE